MKTCTKCGAEKPASTEFFHARAMSKSGLYPHCKVCQTAMCKRWAQANREKVREISRKFRAEHLEQERERGRRERAAAPEKHREKVRLSYQKHREKRIAYSAQYYREHQSSENIKSTVRRAENPLKHRELNDRSRARRYGSEVQNLDYRALWERDRGLCHVCGLGVGLAEAEFDHIRPFCKGGAHIAENVAPSHMKCNRKKNRHHTFSLMHEI